MRRENRSLVPRGCTLALTTLRPPENVCLIVLRLRQASNVCSHIYPRSPHPPSLVFTSLRNEARRGNTKSLDQDQFSVTTSKRIASYAADHYRSDAAQEQEQGRARRRGPDAHVSRRARPGPTQWRGFACCLVLLLLHDLLACGGLVLVRFFNFPLFSIVAAIILGRDVFDDVLIFIYCTNHFR